MSRFTGLAKHHENLHMQNTEISFQLYIGNKIYILNIFVQNIDCGFPSFTLVWGKLGFTGVFISRTCFSCDMYIYYISYLNANKV